jgi:hypothetical protein
MGWWRVGQKLAGGRTKSNGDVELKRRRDLVMLTPQESFPFMPPWDCNGHLEPSQVGAGEAMRWWQHRARWWSAREVSATWSWPRERDGRAMPQCRTVVALKRMGSNGLKNWPWWWDRNKENLSKDFTDPSFARFLIPRIWRIWSTDHGLISDGGLSYPNF